MSKKIKVVLFTFMIVWVVYILSSTVIDNLLLKHYGICGKAVLVNKIYFVRYHKNTLGYKYLNQGDIYIGNSLEDDLTKVGDTINIVYLPWWPKINRPAKYFDDGSYKFDCK